MVKGVSLTTDIIFYIFVGEVICAEIGYFNHLQFLPNTNWNYSYKGALWKHGQCNPALRKCGEDGFVNLFGDETENII